MQTILVTGSNGLLGQKLTEKLRFDNNFRLIATSRGADRYPEKSGYVYQEMDITQQDDVLEIVKGYQPDVIINTAAMTNVDACEKNREACCRLNIDAVRYLADAAADSGSRLVHISTDFIFDGENGPYREDDAVNPLSYYGYSKLCSEELLAESACDWVVLRTILVYGLVKDMSRSNIVLWAKESLKAGKELNIVNDHFRMPTLVDDLADACIMAIGEKVKGIYHVSGKDYMNMFELVSQVADFWSLDKSLLNEISSETLSQAAKRPPRTGFVLDKAIKELGYRPHSFKEGLETVAQQLQMIEDQ